MAYKITRYKLQTTVFQRLFFYRHRRHNSLLFVVSVFCSGVNETALLGCYADVSEHPIGLIFKSLGLLDH